MFTNKLNELFVFMVAAILTAMFSLSAIASPRNKNSILSYTQNRTQTEQVQAIYQELSNEMKRVPAIKEVSFSTRTPPVAKPVKVAYSPKKNRNYNNRLRVTATAYTSHANQTDSTPNIAAWGDRLRPGMKVIAVSRDLLNEYGLKHKQKVHIKGLEGEYVVLDKMNKRWRKKIDIYMGKNLRKAFKWGRRKVEIHWN
jgi:3D (Asp-Asp-Asp) domain-containing protein